jgi:hypothetical protein
MTSSSWDDYVAGGDVGVTTSESDVAYAGIDAATASAVSTDIVDTVVADEPADAGATDPVSDVAANAGADTAPAVPGAVVGSTQDVVDDAASAQDWAGWNAATADDWADFADRYVQYAETNAAASDYHDAAGSDLQPLEDLSGYDPSSADTSQ